MVITYYGISCFRVQSGETVISFDPPSKQSGEKCPRFETNIVLISHDHARHNGEDSLNAKGDNLFVVKGPGEYEVKGVEIAGAQTFHDKDQGKKHGLNTVYLAKIEDVSVCHLGDLGEKELKDEALELLDGVDILFVPIGGDAVLNAEEAANIVNQISPGIVIPMHYSADKTGAAALKTFLKELGQETDAEERLTIKKKEIIKEQTKAVVLKPMI